MRASPKATAGWQPEEIRVAIDVPSGAYDDDPEQAGDSKPEKGRGPGGQDLSSPADAQPAEVRSRMRSPLT